MTKNIYELINDVVSNLNLISYAPISMPRKQLKKWADDGIDTMQKVRKLVDAFKFKEKMEPISANDGNGQCECNMNPTYYENGTNIRKCCLCHNPIYKD